MVLAVWCVAIDMAGQKNIVVSYNIPGFLGVGR